MLLDKEENLRSLSKELQGFLGSTAVARNFIAEVGGNPSPYEEFLRGLRVEKLNAGTIQLQISVDRWLELRATTQDLKHICAKLERMENGSHTHLYAAPTSLILEADDSWPEG